LRLLLLKAAATMLTVGATVVSAVYVTSHLKNPSAPLQPAVLNASTTSVGGVTVGPAVRPTDEPAMTSTYAS
jgi:hypothetical protein